MCICAICGIESETLIVLVPIKNITLTTIVDYNTQIFNYKIDKSTLEPPHKFNEKQRQ